MSAWLCIVGGLAAYVAIGGVVHALVQRFEFFDGGEDVIALFWPLTLVVGAVFGLGWLLARLGAAAGVHIVDAIAEWHQRPKVPRATARRRKGGR